MRERGEECAENKGEGKNAILGENETRGTMGQGGGRKRPFGKGIRGSNHNFITHFIEGIRREGKEGKKGVGEDGGVNLSYIVAP